MFIWRDPQLLLHCLKHTSQSQAAQVRQQRCTSANYECSIEPWLFINDCMRCYVGSWDSLLGSEIAQLTSQIEPIHHFWCNIYCFTVLRFFYCTAVKKQELVAFRVKLWLAPGPLRTVAFAPLILHHDWWLYFHHIMAPLHWTRQCLASTSVEWPQRDASPAGKHSGIELLTRNNHVFCFCFGCCC